MTGEVDRLVGLRAAMTALDGIVGRYRESVVQGKEDADARLRHDVAELRGTFSSSTREARRSGLEVIRSVEATRKDVTERYRDVTSHMPWIAGRVNVQPSAESFDDIYCRFCNLVSDLYVEPLNMDIMKDLNRTYSELMCRLDIIEESARSSLSATVSEAEAVAEEGIRSAMDSNRLEMNDLVLRAKSQLGDIVNTLGEYVTEEFPEADIEGFRRDLATVSTPVRTSEPVTGAVSLDMHGMRYAPVMDTVLEGYFGDLYKSCVLTLPHRMCGPRQTGFMFTYGSSQEDQARSVLNSLCATVSMSSAPGETEVVVYDPSGSLGYGDCVYSLMSVNGPCRVVRDSTELLQTVRDVFERIVDDEDRLKMCQLFLFDFPCGVSRPVLDLLDTVTSLGYGGVSVNLFFNRSARMPGSHGELEVMENLAGRFTAVYTAGSHGFTDSRDLFYVCSEPPDQDRCAEFMRSYRSEVSG